MRNWVGYFVIIGILLVLFPSVSATKINLTVPDGGKDGQIWDAGDCGRTVNNVSNLASVGYDQSIVCFPYSTTTIRNDYRAYFSFNASSYNLCTVNNATLWYYVNGITKYPTRTPWSECIQSPELELGRLFDKIGFSLEANDWNSYGTAIYSLAVSPPNVYSGWKSIFIDAGNITTTGMTDVEIRGDDDWYQCMNTTTQKYFWNIRTTEYTGTASDPVLELNYDNCVASSPNEEYKLALILSFFSSGIFMISWFKKLDDEHFPIKVLFLIVGMFFFLVLIHISNLIGAFDLGVPYSVFMWTIITTIAIITIYIIKNLLTKYLISRNNTN